MTDTLPGSVASDRALRAARVARIIDGELSKSDKHAAELASIISAAIAAGASGVPQGVQAGATVGAIAGAAMAIPSLGVSAPVSAATVAGATIAGGVIGGIASGVRAALRSKREIYSDFYAEHTKATAALRAAEASGDKAAITTALLSLAALSTHGAKVRPAGLRALLSDASAWFTPAELEAMAAFMSDQDREFAAEFRRPFEARGAIAGVVDRANSVTGGARRRASSLFSKARDAASSIDPEKLAVLAGLSKVALVAAADGVAASKGAPGASKMRRFGNISGAAASSAARAVASSSKDLGKVASDGQEVIDATKRTVSTVRTAAAPAM